jgi:hypothetical protein
MKKQKAIDLGKKAKTFLGQELKLTLVDDHLNPTKEVICRFEKWNSIAFKGNGTQLDLKPYAELIDLDNDRKYTVSLKTVVEVFEKALRKVG